MNIDNLFTILLLFAAAFDLAGADCSWGGPVPEMKCGSVGEDSTYTFFIRINDATTATSETFDAEITFNWEEMSSTTTESLELGKLYSFSSTYAYDAAGYYVVGHEIAFSVPGGCLGGNATSSSSALLRVDEDSCKYGVTTNAPTITPYPSEAPTEYPTTSSATEITATPITATILAFLVLIGMLRT